MNESERAYYNQRAPEYDDWYRGVGLFAARPREGWRQELDALIAVLRSLQFESVLDAACGTGYLTRYLPGRVAGLDCSPSMLLQARARLGEARLVLGDALRLPFRPGSFDCLFAAHFYGHLTPPHRVRFLDEAAAIAPNLLIVDAAMREDVEPESTQDRVLGDGSRHKVYKRYFTPAQLASDLHTETVLHQGRWFVAALRSKVST